LQVGDDGNPALFLLLAQICKGGIIMGWK